MDIPYNDRAQVEYQQEIQQASVQTEIDSSKLPQPEVTIIVDGNKLFKPGMKSVFVEDNETLIISSEINDDDDGTAVGYCSCNSVDICSCNTVCTCESVCNCVGNCSCNAVCSCDNHSSRSSGGGVSGCSCAPVH